MVIAEVLLTLACFFCHGWQPQYYYYFTLGEHTTTLCVQEKNNNIKKTFFFFKKKSFGPTMGGPVRQGSALFSFITPMKDRPKMSSSDPPTTVVMSHITNLPHQKMSGSYNYTVSSTWLVQQCAGGTSSLFCSIVLVVLLLIVPNHYFSYSSLSVKFLFNNMLYY